MTGRYRPLNCQSSQEKKRSNEVRAQDELDSHRI
jgi:hypothetical protein